MGPINRAIIHARIDPKSRQFMTEDCRLLWGRLALAWRKKQRQILDEEQPNCEPDSDDSDHEVETESWKQSGKIFPSYEGIAVCRVVAFTNHSCHPNMEVSRIGETGRIQGKAIRSIEKGEIIFMSYIDEDTPLRYRQSELWDGYGFHCKCVKCKAEAAALFSGFYEDSVARIGESNFREAIWEEGVLASTREKVTSEMRPLFDFFVKKAIDKGISLVEYCDAVCRNVPAGQKWGFKASSLGWPPHKR